MELEYLRERAGGLRALLQARGLSLKHGHVLDLLAALPGLRNWPEVNAFPAKVTAAALDIDAAGRLSRRIKVSYKLDVAPSDLLQLLQGQPAATLQIWPEGPRAGIYVTTETEWALKAIGLYETATAGGLFYTEGLGYELDGAIDVGDVGIYSNGLRRVASGTLVVAGPLDLVQEQWEENKSKLIALSNVADAGGRVVLVCRTPEPDLLHQDLAALLRIGEEEPECVDPTLAGAITEQGDLQVHSPFVQYRRTLVDKRFSPVIQPWPVFVSDRVLNNLRKRPHGLLIASAYYESGSYNLRLRTAAALLPDVTKLLGPAVRVLESFRAAHVSKPEEDVLEQLPVVPSIQAALEAGYKVIVCATLTRESLLSIIANPRSACYITTARAMWAGRAFEHSTLSSVEAEQLFGVLNAIASWSDLDGGRSGLHDLWDVYLQEEGKKMPPRALTYSESYVQSKRIIRWENQVLDLLSRKEVSRQRIRTLFPYMKLPPTVRAASASRLVLAKPDRTKAPA